MTQYSSRVHVRPMLIMLDVAGVLCLLIGWHDRLRPEWPVVHPNLQIVAYYDWLLIATGALLLLASLITMIRMFSGKGVVSAEDIVS